MWHRAGLYARDFGHRLCRHYGDTRRRHVTMQVEIDDEEKVSIGTDVERCREETQRRFADEGIVLCRVLPHRSKRPAMRNRDVIKLSIGRNYDAVWPIDIDRHVARINLVIDARSRWPKTYEGNFVRTF